MTQRRGRRQMWIIALFPVCLALETLLALSVNAASNSTQWPYLLRPLKEHPWISGAALFVLFVLAMLFLRVFDKASPGPAVSEAPVGAAGRPDGPDLIRLRGFTTGEISQGTVGEVLVRHGGTSDTYLAYARDGDYFPRGVEVEIIDYFPPRTVVVAEVAGDKEDQAE